MIIVVAVLVSLFCMFRRALQYSNAQWASDPAAAWRWSWRRCLSAQLRRHPAAPIICQRHRGVHGQLEYGEGVPLGIVGVIGLVVSLVFMARCEQYATSATRRRAVAGLPHRFGRAL